MTSPLHDVKDWPYGKFAALVRGLGGPEAAERVLKDAELRKRFAELMVSIPRSFAELLAACKQWRIDDNFNEKHFPLEPIADDKDEWEVCEHQFNNKMFNGLVAFNKLMENPDYLPCGPRRAMEYIANGHLDNQLDHELIITAKWRYMGSSSYVPIFGVDLVDRRRLFVAALDRQYQPDCSWLVLRKKNA